MRVRLLASPELVSYRVPGVDVGSSVQELVDVVCLAALHHLEQLGRGPLLAHGASFGKKVCGQEGLQTGRMLSMDVCK